MSAAQAEEKIEMDHKLPPHMNPFTVEEVDELLRVTLHGGLSRETQQRLLATVANWAELARMVGRIDGQMDEGCCGAGRTSMLNMLTHETFCDAGHLAMRDLLMDMHAVVQKQHAIKLALLPAMFDCGCSRYKVGNGRCEVYGPDGAPRAGRK